MVSVNYLFISVFRRMEFEEGWDLSYSVLTTHLIFFWPLPTMHRLPCIARSYARL